MIALEEPYRTTMLWRYYQTKSIAEIAELQSVPIDTVRTRLARALAQLRTRLDAEYGGDRRAWSVLLTPFALPSGAAAALAAFAGGLLVKKFVAAAALVLLSVGGYAFVASEPATDAPIPVAAPPIALAAPQTSAPSRSDAAPPLAVPGRRSDTASSKTGVERLPYAVRVVAPDGTAVAGATVDTIAYRVSENDAGEFRNWEGRFATTVTDAEGRCSIVDASSFGGYVDGAARLRVIAEGFAVTSVIVVRGADSRVALGHGGTLAIRVVDDASHPVRGATVTIFIGDATMPNVGHGAPLVLIETHTDDVGRLDLRLTPGGYRVRARGPDLRPIDSDPLRIVSDETTEWDVRLDPGVVANVHVLDDSGQPVAGANVRTLGPLQSRATTTTTDHDGRCRVVGIGLPIDGLAPHAQSANRLHYAVDANGFVALVGAGALPPAVGTIDLEIRIERGVALRLHVVDSEARPIPDASARWGRMPNENSPIDSTDAARSSSPSGWIDMPRIAPGARRIWLETQTYGQYERKEHEIEVRASDVEATVVLERVDGVVAGVVLRADESPASGGIVSLEFEPRAGSRPAPSGEATIGVDGRFLLKGVPTGRAILVVWAKPLHKQRFPVDVATKPPESESVFRLSPGRPVSGRVVDREGAAIAGVVVHLTRRVEVDDHGTRRTEFHTESETSSTSDGSFELFADGNGELDVRIRSAQWTPMLGIIRTAKAGDQGLELRLKPAKEGYGISLRVRATSEGKPYVGKLYVTWQTPRGKQMAADMGWDAKSGHRFVVFETGPLDVSISTPTHRPTLIRGARFAETAEGTTLDVDLER